MVGTGFKPVASVETCIILLIVFSSFDELDNLIAPAAYLHIFNKIKKKIKM